MELLQQLLSLQQSSDLLRSRLQADSRLHFGVLSDSERADLQARLRHLDGLFHRLCVSHSVSLSRSGRLQRLS